MEKNIDAVFYEFCYYILPEEYSDLNGISDGAVINARRLKEQNCMAPNFIYESIEDETVEIVNRSRLFPVKINLYTKEEYNKILAEQVQRVCPGCLRFIDDGNFDDLEGHHREISLDGVCYERDDDEGYASYQNFTFWFLNELKEKAEDIKKLIDGGDAEELDKLCKECCEYAAQPYKFYGQKRDDKYFLFMQCRYTGEEYLNMLDYAAHCSMAEGSPLYETNLILIPFIPEGAEGYKGNIDKNILVGRLEQSNVPWKFNLILSGVEEDDFYDYLCFNIGEDRVLRIIEDVSTDELDGTLLTADEICDKIKENDSRIPVSFPPTLPYGWENRETAAPHKRNIDGETSLFMLACICGDTGELPAMELLGEYSYAYLYVPADGADAETIYDTVSYYLDSEDKVPEPVLLKEDFIYSFMRLGFCECSDENSCGCAFDLFVADEKAFYRYIKILAPVLSYYGARLVVFNESGINEYVCGTDILPAGGEESN